MSNIMLEVNYYKSSYEGMISSSGGPHGGRSQEAYYSKNVEVTWGKVEIEGVLTLTYQMATVSITETISWEEPRIASPYSMNNSPEAVSQRIVDFAMNLFEGYKNRHPGVDPEENLEKFMYIIKKAIKKGFKESKEILDGLGHLNKGIKETVSQTRKFVFDKLDQFYDAKLDQINRSPDTKDKLQKPATTDYMVSD